MAKLGPLALRGDRRRFLRMGESRRFAAGAVPSSGVGRRGGIQRLVSARRRRAAASMRRRRNSRSRPGRSPARTATQAVFSPSLSPFGMVDVGAGYQATSWFRADATIEYRFGASLRSGATDAWAGSAQTGDAFRADVASFVGLVNGYVSSRRLVRVFAFPRRWSWLRRQPAVERQREPAPGGAEASPRARGLSFAWAAMAGVDYDLTAEAEARTELPLPELWDRRDRRRRRLPGPRGSDLIPQQTGLERLQAGPHLPDWRGVAGRRP